MLTTGIKSGPSSEPIGNNGTGVSPGSKSSGTGLKPSGSLSSKKVNFASVKIVKNIVLHGWIDVVEPMSIFSKF